MSGAPYATDVSVTENGDHTGQAAALPPPSAGSPPPWTATPAAPLFDQESSRCVGRRVVAGFIDLVPLVLISFAMAERVDDDTMVRYEIAGLHLVVLALIIFAYSFVAETLTGTTAGKRLLGLTVVRDDGTKPGPGAIAVRTAFRFVDALPALYLVGFIVVLATPGKQRVGDLVGHTRVVRVRHTESHADGSLPAPAPATRGKTAIALALGLVALGAGVAGTIARATETPPSERLGRYELDRDIIPFVRHVMSEFEHLSAERLSALFPSGVVSIAESDDIITQLDAAFGTFSGTYAVDDHAKLQDVDVAPLGPLDIIQLKLSAEFAESTETVIVSVAVVDDQLTLVRWDIAPT